MDSVTLPILGTGSPLLLMVTAVVLGALHGLEPGHSKTMMAAFIIAIRGTALQAVILGLAAMVSHTAVVWVLAILALEAGGGWVSGAAEPYLLAGSGLIVIGLGLWTLWQVRREAGKAAVRSELPAVPHYPYRHHHGEDQYGGAGGATGDAHARSHAALIRERFAGRGATTGEVAVFGLTGGLLPCSAAVTVLLICLQAGNTALGLALVGAFSVGLAVTLVGVGVSAALGAGWLRGRWAGLDALWQRLPYLSGLVVLAIGIVMLVHGLTGFGENGAAPGFHLHPH